MKKIIVSCMCLMLVMLITPFVASEEIEFVKNDFKYDAIPLFLFQRWNPLWQKYLKHLDIVSFSIFEDSENPEFLQLSMKVRDFKYSEYRSCYAIYWTYENTHYCVGTNTHTQGKFVSSIVAYLDASCKYISTPIDSEINEENNTLTWIVPKDLIGNPGTGDELKEIHANTYLIYQKDCQVKYPLFLVKDTAQPLLKVGYTYLIQY